jgi:predicted dehydrogenase
MLGAGAMAGGWMRRYLPLFRDRVEVAGLVDLNPEALATYGDLLGLPPSARFADMAAAFEQVEADCCFVVLPPAVHREAVLHAVRRGLPILSEKPIADTWEACRDVQRAVAGAGLKMQVVQNYRFNAPMLTMRRVLRQGGLGRINYLVARFAADYRLPNSWGVPFRHQIPHALLVEGAVHHFDMLRNLAGADVRTIAGWEWNPPWSTSKGAFNNLYLMAMTDGSRASYEGSGTAAGQQNSWHDEHYRAECEEGSVTVGRDHAVRVHRHRAGALTTEEIVPERPAHEGHAAVIGQFLDWLDGGPRPETHLDDNIRSVAVLFAAIEASRAERVVDVEAKVKEVAVRG